MAFIVGQKDIDTQLTGYSDWPLSLSNVFSLSGLTLFDWSFPQHVLQFSQRKCASPICSMLHNSYTCLYTFLYIECPSPPVIDDAILFGNSFTIGSCLLYKCNNNLVASGVIVCQTDGTWSATDVNCSSSTNFDGLLLLHTQINFFFFFFF